MPESIYKKIESIIFGLFSPDDVKKMAAVKLVTPELYDKEGYPVDGGLMDIRLGVIDPGLRCKTCGAKLKECTGHFGHIELARPIIHVKYVKQIMDVLRATCSECSRILIDDSRIDGLIESLNKEEKEKTLDARRKKINTIIHFARSIKKCPHCKAKKHAIKIEKPTTFYEGDKRLTPIDVRIKFEKIPEKDAILLGFNPGYARPEWMILTILPVPPVTMRPSITLETGERSEDDLTHKLGDIIRINQRLFENINAGAPEIIVEDLWDLLQYHITTYFDNTIAQVPPARHRSGQPLKTLTERIKTKEGRFRHNLAGKRVNYAARTVISPDPKIKLNEVGVPEEVAMELSVPEKVNEWNIKWLKEFIKNGPKKYPGANYVLRPDKKKKQITEETTEQLIEELEPGYIVERHLLDGDIAIFNRQPSLHRMSIMGHKIRVLPGKSFRLNPAIAFPYNADFDGDEMNLHVPQTEEARSEAEILMQVQTQIMTPKHGKNVIGCLQDAISGNYLLTKEMNLSREEATQLLVSIGFTDFSFKKNNLTGKEIFSAILPKDFNFIGESKEGEVIIKNGNLIEGIIDKNLIGEEGGLLIRDLHRKYEDDKTLELLERIFRLGIGALMIRGFSIKIDDLDLDEKVIEGINQFIIEAEKGVQQLIQEYERGEIEALPGKTVKETLEARILNLLNKTRNKIGLLINENVKMANPLIIMSKSGARGSILNLVQMSALVGQQALRGRRIEKGYNDRTLSLFKKNDLGTEAHGFIKGSFKTGLSPVEFFFGSMTGRDAMMDTALRTPKSGYLYRRLANALQDMKVEYDSTVRDANKSIVQFSYGEDGMDVSKTEAGTIDVKKAIKDITA